MLLAELIGAIAILAGLYYIGVIISRCIILSARRMEVELEEKEMRIQEERMRLLVERRGEIELTGEESEEKQERSGKEKFGVILEARAEPRNRW